MSASSVLGASFPPIERCFMPPAPLHGATSFMQAFALIHYRNPISLGSRKSCQATLILKIGILFPLSRSTPVHLDHLHFVFQLWHCRFRFATPTHVFKLDDSPCSSQSRATALARLPLGKARYVSVWGAAARFSTTIKAWGMRFDFAWIKLLRQARAWRAFSSATPDNPSPKSKFRPEAVSHHASGVCP